MVFCSPMLRETGVQSQVESYQRLKKWYLIPPCLTLSIIRYGSKVMWSNPWNRVAPSLHLSVVANKKGAFGSLSTMVANFIYLRYKCNIKTIFHFLTCIFTSYHSLFYFYYSLKRRRRRGRKEVPNPRSESKSIRIQVSIAWAWFQSRNL